MSWDTSQMSTRRKPRVLYIAFYFPPSRASGVYRARATANFLAENGWDVTTIAAPMRFLREVADTMDEQLLSTVDPRITVERADFDLYRFTHDIRPIGRFRRNFPLVAARGDTFNERYVFPERYAPWGRSVVRRALRLHLRKRFDLVVATGNPFVAFASAWLFHRLTGVPYVIDYRDSWTLDLFTDAPAFEPGHIAWRWEKRIIKGASAVAFVNGALREWHAEKYPNDAQKLMVVPNGWDPELMEVSDKAPASTQATESAPLRFAYLGTISSAQPVEELVTAFTLARDHTDLEDAELNIHGYLGFFQGGNLDILERLGLDLHRDHQGAVSAVDRGVHYRGPVSKTDVASVYQRSDVLVFLAGGARYVTSGKIFEYMATGKPIVSVHAPGIAATEVLAGYPLWFAADSLEPEAVAQAMIAAGKAARDLTPEQRAAGRAHAAAFTRQKVLAPFETRLRQIVDERGHRNGRDGSR
jgi:glycosyltransferase involved in cell wall biosynthesis